MNDEPAKARYVPLGGAPPKRRFSHPKGSRPGLWGEQPNDPGPQAIDGNGEPIEVDGVPVHLSPTATAHGFGIDRYRWVSGLLPKERSLLKTGQAIFLVEITGPLGPNQTRFKEVVFKRGGYSHRNWNGPEPVPTSDTDRNNSSDKGMPD